MPRGFVVAPWQKAPEGCFVPPAGDGAAAAAAAAAGLAPEVTGGGRWVRCEGGFDGAAAWEWAED